MPRRDCWRVRRSRGVGLNAGDVAVEVADDHDFARRRRAGRGRRRVRAWPAKEIGRAPDGGRASSEGRAWASARCGAWRGTSSATLVDSGVEFERLFPVLVEASPGSVVRGRRVGAEMDRALIGSRQVAGMPSCRSSSAISASDSRPISSSRCRRACDRGISGLRRSSLPRIDPGARPSCGACALAEAFESASWTARRW